MPSQDNPTSPVASGSMTQTLTISVARGLSYGAFQTYHSANVLNPNIDTRRHLELGNELTNPDASLVPAKLLLVWAIVVKSFAGTESVVILGPKVQLEPQASIVLDGETLVVDQIKAIGSQLDGSATSNPAITPVVDQPHRHPLALRYAYSDGDGNATVPINSPLSITLSSRLGRWSAELSTDSRVINQSLLPLLSSTFQSALNQLRSVSSQLTQRDISLSDPQDMGMLQMLAGRPAPPVSSLVHDLIVQRARSQIDAEASVSWDVNLTYAELDGVSDILASHLVSLGLQVGSTVATCLEKSGWVPVIYLAVLKAGGAFAPLNPGLSADQLSSAVGRLSPSIVISSSPNLSKFVGLAEHVLDISDIVKNHQDTKTQLLSKISVTPHDPACIIFTFDGVEGATLLVLDHVAVCTSIATNSNVHDFSPATKTLQFAPYDSSISVADVLYTLAAGGCVCTPSEHERLTGIADACTRMKPSLACLTPSLAAVLNQDDLPGVDTIILAGEPLEMNSAKRWASATNLINAYTPAAALGYACSTAPLITISSPGNIGWPRGCAVWVMDPQDPTRLAPPGAVGQLLVESPFLGQKYESVDGISASALVPRPECLILPVFSPKPAGDARCFLTEHLVRFDIGDGTLQLLGRKSSQGQLLQFDSHDGESPASTGSETPTVTGPVSTPMVASASQTSLDTNTIDVNFQAAETRFALLSLSPQKLSHLEALLKPLGSVQDCYPCCPVQEGILVSQVKAPGTYNILVVWELVNGANVSLASLRAAWERVVQRHAPLRSTFVESLRDGSVFDQVVLTSPSVDVVEVPWLEDLTEADDMLQLTAATWNKGKPQHRLGLSRAANGRLRCQLLISHAVIDGLSVHTLGHDLERSLNGVLSDSLYPDLQHRYTQQLQQAPEEDAREFWRTYLDGLSGCLLPKLTDLAEPQSPVRVSTKRRTLPDVKRLRRFCQEQGTTLFSLTQAAWAMVLRAYTLSDDVCFAFMATDRHLLGDDANDAVGFFINLMLCRIGLEGSTPIADVLTALRRDFVSSFPYQHHSLAEIAHEQGIPASQLFNTTMTFVSNDDDAESHCDGVQLHRVADQDVAEYDVVVRVFDSHEDNVAVEFSYWSTAFSSAQAENVFGAFLAAINSIPQSATVDDVELMDENMKRQILQWNEQPPIHVDACTHELILDAAKEYPDAPAIESHDGSLSYGELDIMTRKLAVYLQSLKVGPEVPVVFRMEKSLWAIVAMISVMRAGGLFVPLDPAWPVDRAQFIIDDVGSSILLTTDATHTLPLQHINHTLVLSPELFSKIPAEKSLSSQVKPSNPAYILYTSGSTGQPKGVVVEHQTLSTSSKAHGKAMLMDRQTRAFQFSSYTFDVSLGEIITTLVYGGCVCIPSPSDRLSNISGAISKLRANQLFMTTTTLGTFGPQDCPSVKTVVCGGELLSQAIKDVWAPHVNLIHGYGPTEACIYAVSCNSNDPALPPSVIGHSMDGSRIWVSRPGNPQALTPIGALGELLIDGPIVAREYFNDPARTNETFLDQAPTSWGTPSLHRVYRTGDLVRYNMDGSLTFFGRRDGQLKVRGQRCEAGDIENHLTAVEPDIAHCAVLVPKEGACASRLVAVISFKTTHPGLSTRTGDLQLLDPQQISDIMTRLGENLAQQVPNYMVPQIWLPVVSLPSTTACKTDRRRVSRWVDKLSSTTLDNVLNLSTTHSASFSADRSPVHMMLATAWGEALGVAVDNVPDDRSFFSLGGDSILAILVVNRCRAQGIELSVSDILRGRTINEMANSISISDQQYNSNSNSTSLVRLNPAESLALGTGFKLQSCPPRHSRTSKLQLARPIDQQALEDAVKKLVELHTTLQTTYVNEENAWFRRVGADLSKILLFNAHDGSTQTDSVLERSRALLDATTGPLLTADYFPSENRLALSALHISLDLPSWEILVRDLDCILTGYPVIPPARPAAESQNYHAAELSEQEADLGYWELDPEETYLPHEMKYELRIDSDASEMLQKTCAQTLLSPVDVLVTAAAESFTQGFTDRTMPVIHVADNVQDHVGYGDSVYPVQLPSDLTATGAPGVAAMVKNARLAAITKGVSSYMAASYTPSVLAARLPEILVRYSNTRPFQGRILQQLDNDISDPKSSSAATLIPSCISITASVHADKSLGVVVAHSWDLGQQKKVRKWVRLLQTTLLETIRGVAKANFMSPADFPLVHVPDDKAWERLRSTINDALGPSSSQTVEDVYPCSPVQQGMLLSQAKSTSSYTVDVVWKMHTLSSSSKVSVARLKNAWAKVVQRHASLRTIFVDGSAANEAFLAAVLRNPPVTVLHQTLVDGDGVEALLAFEPQLPVTSHEPPHILTIAETQTQDQVLVHLRINHAVVDGVSLDVLQRDLQRAYIAEDGSAEWLTSDQSFRDYVSYVQTQDTDRSMDFWKNRLSTVSACRFPQLQVPDVPITNEKRVFKTKINDISPLLTLCQANSLSISNLAQLAWALVLRAYTNNHHVCFGYMTSGRDAPVGGIESATGVFINLLISDLALDDAMTIREALEASRAGLADSIDHQYCPLSKIQRALHMGSEPFFNTVLSCYREDEPDPSSSKTDVAVDLVHLDDTSEFAIAAKIAYTRSDMELSLTYSTGIISPEAADVVGNVWLQTLQCLPSLFDDKISNVNLMDPQSSHLVKAWNKHVPDPVDACLHDIITNVAALQPDKMALYSTAGSLTYGELDDYSTRLGHHLVSLGVGPETIVPLLFEKSIWAVVAMLGVLKAGGAFVALDPAHPADRLALIISDTGSPVLLVSDMQAAGPLITGDMASLHVALCTVTQVSVLELPIRDDKPCTAVTPDNAAYVIFTSGSTGRPKGVVIEHRAVSTGTKEHGSQMSYTSTSRVLQFASYAFDATIGEVFTTLVHHGCVCIASETERIEDLTGFMNRASVTWAFLTPAVARMMTPNDVPTLETLICGGEPLGDLTPRIWSEKVKFIQAYGPTETCVFASISNRQHREVRPAIIGHMMGSAAWIVSPSNADLLVPVGAVGEMLIEGPILGRGYRNDADKTNASFVWDPKWSIHYPRHANGRRLYKTGDLVRYNLNGSMDFVQRKDTQIKIRGQRVEAGEIESHITSAHKDVQHVYVTFTKNGGLSSRLVAVVSLRGFGSTETSSSGSLRLLQGADYERAKELLRTVTEYLSSKLPRHMVPAVWAVVQGSSVPLTTSGKIDRRQMTAWLEQADEDLVREILALDQEEPISDDSLTPAEVALRSVWALVLNLDPHKINREHPFFSLGGDSITAMQVVSHCRSQGIELTVKDIFKHQTIAALAAFVDYTSAGDISSSSMSHELDLSEQVDKDFALSPIQKMYFDLYPDGVNHFNQSFLVQIPSTKKVASSTLHTALGQLVSRHSMLRARYLNSQGRWVQRVTDNVAGSLQYQEHTDVELNQINDLIDSAQQSLDIQRGPIVSAKLIHLPDRQILAIVAHHLVVDMVSWRVLLEELEAILTGRPLPTAALTPVPFQTWVRIQSSRVKELSAHKVLPYTIPEPRLDYWGLDEVKSNDWGSVREISFELNEAMTKALLGPCNEPLQTDPQDLFLTAAFRSFAQAFPDRPLPAIFTEGHGREADVEVDLSRTVGWFTSIVPVALTDGVPGDLIETLMRIKDSRRSVPSRGVPYFSYRYLSQDGVTKFRHHDQMEILFNYHGQYQQLERDGALLQPIPEGEFAQRDVEPSARRLAVFDIAVAVAAGRATVSLLMPQSLTPTLSHQVSVWNECFQKELASLISMTSTMQSEFTLNDIPLIKDISYANLAEIKTICLDHTDKWGPASIEEIFPCSPMQQGILLSQSRTPDLYDVRFAFEVTSRDGVPQVHRLQEAWEQVVKRQPMLRTVFLPNLRGSGSFDQAVLRNHLATVHHVRLEEVPASSDDLVEKVRETMAEVPASSFEYGKVPHEFTIYTVGSRMFVLLRLSHALVDGASLPYIIQDLQQAYSQSLPAAPGLGYRELVSFIQQQPMDQALEYWSGYLNDASPCRLPLLLDDAVPPPPRPLPAQDITVPDSEPLRRLCAKHGVTMASIFHAAWALILRAYTGDDEVHFGYLASGRDAPIQGVTSLVGPLINMLICRVNFDPSVSVVQLLQDICADFASSMSNQYISLAEVQHGLGLGSEQLFTTVVSFQRHDPTSAGADDSSDSLKLTAIDSRDPTEYDISLNVVDSDQELSFTFTYWTSKISSAHATHMIRALLSALASFAEKVDQPIVNVNLVSTETRRELDAWNATSLQELRTECVHTLFEQQVQEIPNHPAICAWDRDFTYRELNEAANAFAHHLHSLGHVKPDTFVVTCFDKSAWVAVSQMAILKAGAALAAVDPTHPIDRIKTIVHDLGSPSVLLTETKYKDRFEGIFSNVVIVDQEKLDSLGPRPDAPSTEVNGNNLSYSIFTSGSTGQPKGILIEHQSLSTVAKHFARPYQVDRNTRSLQFAANTFDLSIGETFITLLNGGCLCVPSERRRLEDLTGVINDLDVNWAFLTPTMADILDPALVPGLNTLILAGEAATSENIRRWHDKVFFIIAYGPAETTVCCNAACGVTASSDPSNFGPARGAGIWVTDMNDPSILLPVGAVGEIIVEGPIVGRGYVDPVKTAEVFIDPPAWLTTQFPNKKLYRSGDIGRYNPDGTCSFVRRRDNQVKVRGQRIELNEVEIHVSQADPDLRHAVVLYPKTGACQGRLTTVLSRRQHQEAAEAPRVLSAVNNKEVMARNAAIRSKLSSTLPGYMIPKIWITVEELPLTTNGKMDRRQILNWVQALTDQDLASIVSSTGDTTTGSEDAKAQTPMEKQLVKVWSQILNLPVSSLPLDQSFTSLGGDSISAMQVVSRARECGVTVSVDNILRSQSLSELAGRARFKALIPNNNETQSMAVVRREPFPLLPIQRMFFEMNPSGNNHFNQTFTVRLSKNLAAEQIKVAIATVVKHHPMLRARFFKDDDDHWTQQILPDVEGSFAFQQGSFPSLSDALPVLDELQASLDIQQGPLVTSYLINLPDGQALSLAAHHLVVDLVSWRVILSDLELLLSSESGSPPSLAPEAVSMPTWTEALLQRANDYHVDSVLPVTVPSADFGFWGMDHGRENVMADTVVIQARLDATSTAALLGRANTAFGTDPDDLMLAALAFSFLRVFPQRSVPTIYTEGHGRNAWDDSIDLSRTVGWFTTIYPLVVSNQNTATLDLIQTVRQVKDMRRSIRDKGFPYFACRYLTEQGRAAFKEHTAMEVLFNYLGQYQQLQQSDTILQELRDTPLDIKDAAPSTPRMALLDILATVEGSELVLSLGYNAKMAHRDRLQLWLDEYSAALQSLSTQLPAIPPSFTPGDFPLLGIDDTGLISLEAACKAKVGFWGPAVVESVYPCSPLQQGILVSQSKDPKAYVVYAVWKIRPARGMPFRLQQLEDAWRRLVRYHPVLRTIFCESGRTDGVFAQVLLRAETPAAEPIMRVMDYQGTDPVEFLRSSAPSLPLDKPPHILSICTSGGETYVSLQVSHALIDGTSMNLVMDDLLRAYNGTLQGSGPSYNDYISHVYREPIARSLSYWADNLADTQPCLFPVLSDGSSGRVLNKITLPIPSTTADAMRQLGRTHGISISNIFQLAWSLVLRAFTGSDSVCFGYLTSGRDVPVDRIEAMVGPLISMLIASTTFSDDAQSALELLQTINRSYIDSLPHQHCSLGNIQHALGVSNTGLFNTVMSLQKITEEDETPEQLGFDIVDSHDPSEVCHVMLIVLPVE
ncbi:nrps5 single domain, non-ribosomal peptide synthase-like protein [Fusarium sp. DS 682]|nr:nrps5 single domain, non-ribosomal peptide synthase-like protein [Fusarium sp. DS 682]